MNMEEKMTGGKIKIYWQRYNPIESHFGYNWFRVWRTGMDHKSAPIFREPEFKSIKKLFCEATWIENKEETCTS
jgi:hypothetical protein